MALCRIRRLLHLSRIPISGQHPRQCPLTIGSDHRRHDHNHCHHNHQSPRPANDNAPLKVEVHPQLLLFHSAPVNYSIRCNCNCQASFITCFFALLFVCVFVCFTVSLVRSLNLWAICQSLDGGHLVWVCQNLELQIGARATYWQALARSHLRIRWADTHLHICATYTCA